MKKIIFESKKISAKDLKAGDFFATQNAETLNAKAQTPMGVGIGLLVRTDVPYPKRTRNEKVFKITIKKT